MEFLIENLRMLRSKDTESRTMLQVMAQNLYGEVTTAIYWTQNPCLPANTVCARLWIFFLLPSVYSVTHQSDGIPTAFVSLCHHLAFLRWVWVLKPRFWPFVLVLGRLGCICQFDENQFLLLKDECF